MFLNILCVVSLFFCTILLFEKPRGAGSSVAGLSQTFPPPTLLQVAAVAVLSWGVCVRGLVLFQASVSLDFVMVHHLLRGL